MTALYALRGVALQRGARVVLEVPTLDLQANTVTAVLGPNGAGKSTLLEALACLLLPARGTLHYDGTLLTPGNATLLARRLGYVAQQPYLFERSVRANVTLGLRLRGASRVEAGQRADAMLERFGLAPLAGVRARELSGGEAQKLALARTLVLSPEVLLLDEPFTALDAAAAADLRALLRNPRALGARAIVFSTHDETLAAALADVTVRLGAGLALATSPPAPGRT